MVDFLDDLIRTSKSGHTFDEDMKALEAMLQDNIDRWGLGVVEVSVLSYVINKHAPKKVKRSKNVAR